MACLILFSSFMLCYLDLDVFYDKWFWFFSFRKGKNSDVAHMWGTVRFPSGVTAMEEVHIAPAIPTQAGTSPKTGM